MALIGDCYACGHKDECYPMPIYTESWANDLFKALIALRRRDLCANSGKVDWKMRD